jgi:hypothetical protein
MRKYFWRYFLLLCALSFAFDMAWSVPKWLLAPHTSHGASGWQIGGYENGIFAGLVGMTLASLRVFSEVKFFWPTSVLALIFMALLSYLRVPAPWASCFFALPMIGIGIMRLRRFLREHPKLESADGQ